MERQPPKGFYDKVKVLDSNYAQTGESGFEARARDQRAMGGQLTPMAKKSSGIFGGKRSKIKGLIEKYNATDNLKAKKKHLLEIRQLQVDWLKKAGKKASKAKGDDVSRHNSKLTEIAVLGNDILMEAQWLDDGGRPRIDEERKEARAEVKEEKIEMRVAESASPLSIAVDTPTYQDTIIDYLGKHGYRNAGQYHTKNYGDYNPHVGWKAHIGATLESSFTILDKVLPIVDKYKFSHKVDSKPEVFNKTNKFITIYPPENEELWAPLIEEIEAVLGHDAILVPGELAVGQYGHVGMRHGQLTALTIGKLDAQEIEFHKVRTEENGNVIYQLDNPAQYDPRIKDGIMTTETADLTSAMYVRDAAQKGKFCPAMIYKGKVYPDPRATPNPFGFALPKGI